MFIETLEFTIPIDLCVVFSALQKGPKANLEFPASVSSYGTTQDASIQVLVKSNKLTFKVDGVSSESSIIAKSDCRTLKLAVFDVDRSLIPVETPSPVPVTAKRSYEEVTSKRNHDDSVSNPKSLKSSRTFSDNVGPDNQFRNISQNNSATTPLSSKPPPPPPPPPSVPQRMPQRNNAESNSVQVKVEPEDPDLIEIDEDEAEGLEPKTEIPYMQEHYASSSPQIPPDRVSFPSSSSSFQQNVQHVQPNYAEAGTSHQGEQSADDYLVYQDDVDYSDNDNSADYTNEERCAAPGIPVSAGDIYLPFVCVECGKIYKNNRNLQRHIRAVHIRTTFPCHCGKTYTRTESLRSHMIQAHGHVTFLCHCGDTFSHVKIYGIHQKQCSACDN